MNPPIAIFPCMWSCVPFTAAGPQHPALPPPSQPVATVMP